MPLTDKPSRSTGIYESTCCGSEVRVGRGQAFPKCPACRMTAVWLPVRTIQDSPRTQVSRAGERRQGDRRNGEERRAEDVSEPDTADS